MPSRDMKKAESSYARKYSRPHTAGDAGDVDVADGELRFFLGILRIFASRADQELSNEPPAVEIARLDFENRVRYEFGYLFARRESSWAGALAPARYITYYMYITHIFYIFTNARSSSRRRRSRGRKCSGSRRGGSRRRRGRSSRPGPGRTRRCLRRMKNDQYFEGSRLFG